MSAINRIPDYLAHMLKGMRNRIAHGYFEINLDTVWETVQTALPELTRQLPAIIDGLR
jgi:uncharacterized protein with HEPN domain